MLDSYGAGIQITQVQLQKVDPPTQVIDSFRDVQAARADLERAQNEAQTYANRVVPEARGRAAQITASRRSLSRADGGRSHAARPRASSASTKSTRRRRRSPASACISRPWSGCSAATDKIILDSGGGQRRRRRAVPAARSVDAAAPAAQGSSRSPRREAPDETQSRRRHRRRTRHRRADHRLWRRSSRSTRRARRSSSGSVEPVRVVTEPGLHFKMPLIDSVIHIDKRILDLENPAQEVIASDQKRLVVDAFARYKITDPLRFYQTVSTVEGANSRLSTLLNSALRRVLGENTLTHVVRDERGALMAQGARAARARGEGLRHRRRRRADPPRRSAGAEQPGGLPAHADRAAARSRRVPRAGQPACAGNPRQGRPRRHGAARRGDSRRRTRSAAKATASATASSPMRSAGIRTSSRSIGRCRPTRRDCAATRGCCCKPDSDFFRYFVDPSGKPRPASERRLDGRRRDAARRHGRRAAGAAPRYAPRRCGRDACPISSSPSVWCSPSRD